MLTLSKDGSCYDTYSKFVMYVVTDGLGSFVDDIVNLTVYSQVDRQK